jgi:26S proteasome regulatory subunit N2
VGLGIAGMGGKNLKVFNDLKQVLFMDSAVVDEATGYAMGLILLGIANVTSADEMLTYAQETQHGKIICGLAIDVGSFTMGIRKQQMRPFICFLLRRFIEAVICSIDTH